MLLASCLVMVGCAKIPLYNNLHEVEVNEMMAILLSRGIAVEKIAAKENMWNVSVEAERLAEAVDILNSFGYPKNQFETIGTLFKKSGLVSSPSEERIRFMYGLSQGLGGTLTQIDGVLTARVHIVLTDNDPLKGTSMPASASVFIKFRRGSGVESLSSQIKRLVTNSIEGLEYEKVSLIFVPSELNEFTTLVGGASAAKKVDNTLIFVMAGIGFLVLLMVLGGVGYMMMRKKPVGKVAKSAGKAK